MNHDFARLAYPDYALSPWIDAETMWLNRDEHHGPAFERLQQALAATPWGERPIEQVLANLDLLPEDRRDAVRHYGGAHANHSLFWSVMSPVGSKHPTGALARAIENTFGSLEGLKHQIEEVAAHRLGPGWVWLVHGGTGLAVVATANEDSPWMSGDVPLLGIDL